MLKYVSKFVLESLPSVVATIVGAYIVNYYIIPKAVADRPAAALASTSDPRAVDKDLLTRDAPTKALPAKVEKVDVTPSNATLDSSSDTSVAKGGTKPATAEKSDSATASVRRHQPAPREKAAVEKVVVKPQPAPVATASVVPANETPPAVDERRDANDLARAAIERLRVTNDGPRVQEAARAPDAPRIVSAPAMQPLPPAIMVSAPPVETFNPGQSSSGIKPPYAPVDRADGASRLRPPGEIPTASRPLDLRAEATGSVSREGKLIGMNDPTTVADDVLSAAKSVFHAVLPK